MAHARQNSTDLTQGRITPQLLGFAMPILLGQIFQNLYSSVDSIVVGRFVGTTALAAVSSSGDVSNLLIGFFTGLSAGAGILFSRYFGAKDQENLHDSIHTALLFSLILGVFMAAVGVILTPWLLTVVACPPEVMPEAVLYLRIYFAGILFTSLYNVGSGVLRAVGDSRDPFYYLVAASVTNIVLDVVFVVWFRLGVLGVAVATVISQGLSVVLTFGNMLCTRDVYRMRWRDLKLHKKHMREIVDLGLPAAIQSSIISVSNLFVQRFVNLAGVDAMGGIGAAKKVDKFVVMPFHSLGLACSTFVSQNLGAKKPDRAFRGVRSALVMSLLFTAVAGTVLYIFAELSVSIFTDDPGPIAYGADMLRTVILFYAFQVLNAIYPNAARGFGKSKSVMVYSVLGMVVVRQIFLHIAMGINNTVRNIYYAWPVGWIAASLFVMVDYYFTVVRPHRALTPQAKLF